MSGRITRRLLVMAFGGCAIVGGCALFTDLDDLSGAPETAPAEAGSDADGASEEDAIHGGDDASTAADADGAADSTVPLVACDDAGAVCLAPPPIGWDGPVFLYDGPINSAVPACTEDTTSVYTGHGSPTAPPAGCQACKCGTVSGTIDCNGVDVITFNNGGCPGYGICAQVKLSATCQSIPVSCGHASTLVTAPYTRGGSCPASGGQLFDGGAPSFTRAVHACAVTSGSGSCQAPERCVPAPPSSFAGRCIVKLGESVECPPGQYAERHVYYEGIADERRCTACGCAPPQASCGAGSLSVTACGPSENDVPRSLNECSTTPIQAARVTGAGVVLSSAACKPTGGAPSGSVRGTGPTTICCAR
jgi:hypothetical protein